MKKQSHFSTVRGAKLPPTTRRSTDQVFGFATIPKSFSHKGPQGSPHSPLSFGFQTPQSQYQHQHAPQYATVGRTQGQNVASFGWQIGRKSDVVEGLVVNRFQKPVQNMYAAPMEVKRADFSYREPGPVRSASFPAPSPGKCSGDYQEPDSSFDTSVEDPPDPDYPDSEGDEMSYNNNFGSYPPAIPENPPTPRKAQHDNKPSLLLNRDENQIIYDILGKGRQTLATAVVRLLVPTPDQSHWQVKDTGVVCLVRDTTKKSYFIQVYNLATKTMVFRQEIYNQFEYDMPHTCFLTFEGDSSTVGISFADPTEAGNFRAGLDSKLEAKRQRRNEREMNRRSRIMTENNQSSNFNNQQSQSNANKYLPQSHVAHPPAMNGASNTVSTTYTFPTSLTPKSKGVKSKGKDKKKLTLRKEDIGQPMDFRHVQHVGWDPNQGFELNGLDTSMRTFFEKAGVSSEALKDESTRKFIYNFIEQQGGVETIRNVYGKTPAEEGSAGPPPLPTRSVTQKPAAPPPPQGRPVPPVPSYNQNVAPPPPPMRTTSSAERTPVHQFQNNNQSGPARPPPPTFANSSPRSNYQPSNGSVPPPPPPPPPLPAVGAPPPPPPPPPMMMDSQPTNIAQPSTPPTPKPSLPAVGDDRSNLLSQIQKGVKLKHVDPTDTPPKRTGGLADCLNQIQKGVGLKPVQQMPKEPPSLDTMDGLAGALARALADRSKAINPDSSSDSDEDEEVEDDDWD